MTTTAQQSTPELVRQAGEQLSHLVRTELALAQAELRHKAGQAAGAAGLLGAAASAAFWAGGALTAAAVLGLTLVVQPWLAALITAAALLAVACVIALAGRSRLRRLGPLTPQRALRGLHTDVSVLTHPTAVATHPERT
ncbi:phage holin family protein [Catellatospora sp. KI3]|uniref:phage holin family protein n=1 Tax=Catellatospora sp. KI3 TaxID=3041620 RepID=UPI00248274FB|nr:phage holin family protein [Catellatospora sp. KI3]MDI1462854.1 phage holin family protein [Catellatospora sp. KI3]